MRVLIYCPTRAGKAELYPQTVASIDGLTVPEGVEVEVVYDDKSRQPDRSLNILQKYRRGRRRALKEEFDALLTVESDMLVPEEALEQLLAVEADVAYALYCFRRGHHEWNAHEPPGYFGSHRPGRSFSRRPDKGRRHWGKVKPVGGLGLGCTLIHRRVLEKVNFRLDQGLHCDWCLAVDCIKEGFKQACDFSAVCGHILRSEPLQAVWPTMDTEERYIIVPVEQQED